MAFQTHKDKVAIVTGASRGIGAGIAYELAARGAHVVLTYTSASSKPKVDELLTSIAQLNNNSTCLAVAADLRDPQSPAEIVEATKRAFPDKPISILVNNAGCELHKPLAEITLADYAYVYELNVRAVLLMTQAVLPHLASPGGRIVNVGSISARKGFAEFSLYGSSKAALEAFTRCWASELGPRGVTVNAVNPGPVESDMLQQLDQALVDALARQTPAGNRRGRPNDIAQIVAWLAQEESRWVTGQTLSAMGGLEMY